MESKIKLLSKFPHAYCKKVLYKSKVRYFIYNGFSISKIGSGASEHRAWNNALNLTTNK